MSKPKSSVSDVDRKIASIIAIIKFIKNIDAKQISDHLGITRSQWYKYESGKNKLSTKKLESLSEVLGVKLETLFGADKLGNAIFDIANELKESHCKSLEESKQEEDLK